MTGHEPTRDEATGSLPGTIAAAHLAACAAAITEGLSAPNGWTPTVGEVSELVHRLTDGQRRLGDALAALETRVRDGYRHGGLSAAVPSEVLALTQVLRSGAAAAGHTAEALAEARPALTAIEESAGRDTHL